MKSEVSHYKGTIHLFLLEIPKDAYMVQNNTREIMINYLLRNLRGPVRNLNPPINKKKLIYIYIVANENIVS
jgi:hypothetical protein